MSVPFLFDVPPLDPTTLIGAAILFVTVGLLACYVPARVEQRPSSP